MIDKTLLKDKIKQFWNKKPCGTFGTMPKNPTLEYFLKIKERRYRLEPFIQKFAQFEKWNGKTVLEIGCGLGIDGIEFAKNGANYTGIDISDKSIELAKTYFDLNNQKGNLLLADDENLPFENDTFDLVYSWGVLYHTPDIRQAIKEIYRLLKSDGRLIIMLYNNLYLRITLSHSLFQLHRFQLRRLVEQVPLSHLLSQHLPLQLLRFLLFLHQSKLFL